MNKYDGIDKRIVLNVKQCAKNLKRKIALCFMSIDDIEQELMCEIFTCMNKFDANRGDLEHFIRKVLCRRCPNLIKTYKRKKRDSFIKFSEYNDEVCNDRTDDIFNKYRTELEKYMDAFPLMNDMSIRYRLLYQLLLSHSVVEVSKMIGLSRFTILRNLKVISLVFRCMNNPEKCFWSLNGRIKSIGKNLSIIESLDIKELSKLEVYELAELNEQLTKLISHTKELKEKLDDALNLRFAETIKENLRKEKKYTGTTKFIENGFQITAEIPKKVTWDNVQMEKIIKQIPEMYRKSIVKTSYSIDERKYASLSYEYQLLFNPARTVTPGKIRYQITLPEVE